MNWISTFIFLLLATFVNILLGDFVLTFVNLRRTGHVDLLQDIFLCSY